MNDKNIKLICNCDECKNKAICKHTDNYQTSVSHINKMVSFPEVMSVSISCDYFANSSSIKRI